MAIAVAGSPVITALGLDAPMMLSCRRTCAFALPGLGDEYAIIGSLC
jgi:hypothetical protein